MRISMCLLIPVLLLGAGCASNPDYPRRPNPQEIASAEGVYGLSDGYRAHLFGMDDDLYVRIGAGPQKRLLIVAPDRFVSTRGDVKIQFQPARGDDDIQHIVVEYHRRPDARPPLRFSTGMMPGRGLLD